MAAKSDPLQSKGSRTWCLAVASNKLSKYTNRKSSPEPSECSLHRRVVGIQLTDEWHNFALVLDVLSTLQQRVGLFSDYRERKKSECLYFA